MSLKRRNQISYALGLSLWERYYTALLEVVPPTGRLVTHFGALFDASTREADRLLDFAAVPRTCRSGVLEAINPELRHQRAQVSLADAGVSQTIHELYARLCEEAGWGAGGRRAHRCQVSVRAAVLDLATTKELADRQGRAISALEGRIGDVREERDSLADRVGELQVENDAAGWASAGTRRRERSPGQPSRLAREISLLLGERLAAAETDVHGVVLYVDGRADGVTRARDLPPDRQSDADRADSPVVAAGRRAIYDHVPIHGAVLVAGKSDPAFADIVGRRVTNFPQDGSGRYPGFALADSQAMLAHLEALRCAGNRFLLMPCIEPMAARSLRVVRRVPPRALPREGERSDLRDPRRAHGSTGVDEPLAQRRVGRHRSAGRSGGTEPCRAGHDATRHRSAGGRAQRLFSAAILAGFFRISTQPSTWS